MDATAILLGKENHGIAIVSTEDWHHWCRLCAKADMQNVSIFFKDEHLSTSTCSREPHELRFTSAIDKYFRVQIKRDEGLPNLLCKECFSMVTSLVNFNERVTKVQQMYAELKNLHDETGVDFHTVRLKYGILENDLQQLYMRPTLPEIHYLEAKPKVNECEKRVITEEVNDTGTTFASRFACNIKKEHLTDETQAEEDAYEFENDEQDGEDPFGSDCEEEPVVDDNLRKINNENSNRYIKDIYSKRNSMETLPSERCQTKVRPKKKRQSHKNNDKSPENHKTTDSFGNEAQPHDVFTNEVETLEQNRDVVDLESDDKGKVYVCSECSQSFKRISYYRLHMERKHAKLTVIPRFACSQCSRSFNTQNQLNNHSAKHLPLIKRRVVPCPYCEQKFPSKTYVPQHIKFVHMNERSFICEECGEAVRTKAALRVHMLRHTDYAPYECEVCRKGFKNQVRLKNHMETHNPNKHICAECGLQLNSRSTLNRHLLVHSDVMQHKCDYCGRAFKRAKALKNHLILHTGLKPYTCDFCDRTFANGSNCRTHKRKAHPEELAALEASGGKTYTKNIPKLAVLKSVTRIAENLAPVVSKQSGNFSFGKKPKLPPESIGTVSVKHAKVHKQALDVSPASIDLNAIPGSVMPAVLSNNQNTTEENSKVVDSIPTIDNIYSHLLKQTAPNSRFTVLPATLVNDMHLDVKRPRSGESSQASNSCVGSEATSVVAQHQPQSQLSQNLPQEPSPIPTAVQNFYTQFMKQQHMATVVQQHPLEPHLQHDDASIRSPESRVSHQLLDEPSAASTPAVTNFYNQLREHAPDMYI